MSMKRFVCWSFDQTAVRRIINPDADSVPDHVFRAVHTDMPIPVSRVYGQGTEMLSPTAFLARFLDPALNFQLVPVLGYAGVGKSHLLHWMSLHVPRGGDREVIVVPKAKTNLRDVVISIVKKLPPDEQGPYLEQLQMAAGTSMNKAAQRLQVLSSLAIAVTNDQVRAGSGLDASTEEYLLQALPAILTDNHVRSTHFEIEGGLAAEIAAHVFEKPQGYDPAEDRREFHHSDLPLSVRDHHRAGADAADCISLLMNDEDAVKATLDILNRNLDTAIASCLNMGGQRLVDLMTKVRKHLKSQNKELVVLIEDFARLQGLDAALLQVLLERPDGENAHLCSIRTAFAVTTGYYLGLQDTVETRTTFLVDLGTPDAKGIDYEAATARYLNALRWGEERLRQQLSAADASEARPVASRCAEDCEHQPTCHATFGYSGEYGLYPLTSQAVRNLVARVAALEEKRSRPITMRAFQSMVLTEIAEAGRDLKEGNFPPPKMLQALGGQTLSAVHWETLRRRDPALAQRRLTLHELWSGGAEVRDFSNDLHEAFDLPPIGNKGNSSETGENGAAGKRVGDNGVVWDPVEDPVESDKRKPLPTDPVVGELDRWASLGPVGRLSQATAQGLRDLLFRALRTRIDWDTEGLIEGAFCGSGRPFQGSSILFDNAETGSAKTLISLAVPCTSSNAIALQGLWQRHKGASQFDHAAEKLVLLANLLDELAQQLLEKLRSVDTARGQWDPVEAAFGIAVAGILATQAQVNWRDPVELVRSALAKPPKLPEWLDDSAALMMTSIVNAHEKALLAIYHRAAATKGSSTSDPMLDAARLLRIARAMGKDTWSPSKPPDIPPQYQEDFARPARDVARDLPKHVERETVARSTWRERMLKAFGEQSRAAVVRTIKDVVNGVGGVGLGVPSGTLLTARSEFERTDYDTALRAARLRSTTSYLGALAAMSPAIRPAALAATKLAEQLEHYLAQSEKELDNQERSLGINQDGVEASEVLIRDALTSLKECLDA